MAKLLKRKRKTAPKRVLRWVKATLDEWTQAAAIRDGRLFRCVNRSGAIWGEGITEKVVWHIVKHSANRTGIQQLAPHDCWRYAESKTMPNQNATAWPGAPWNGC